MSIINEALKKTQNSLGTRVSPPSPIKTQKNTILWSITILIFLGLIACSIAFMWALTKNAPKTEESLSSSPLTKISPPSISRSTSQRAKMAPVIKKASTHGLILNGIVSMGDDQFALINNQIFKEGDYVEGKRIISISTEKVEIFDKGHIITLTTKH